MTFPICSSWYIGVPSGSSMTEMAFLRFRFLDTAWKYPEFLSPRLSHRTRLLCLQYSFSEAYAALSSFDTLEISYVSFTGSVSATSSSAVFSSICFLLLRKRCLLHSIKADLTIAIFPCIILSVAFFHACLTTYLASGLSFSRLS